MVVDDDTDALAVYGPDLLVLVDVAIETEHIEQDIDGQHGTAAHMKQIRLHHLFLELVSFEET